MEQSMGCRRRRDEIIGDDDVVGSSSGSIDFQDILPKRKKNHPHPEHNSDRLSELPDSLLVEILSLLPMEDAVRSGILCKRWKSLWTLVDRIRFPYASRFYQRFTSFVDQTLMQCSCPNLKEFSLSYYVVSQPTIEKCLQYVSSKNVKFLNLELNNFIVPVLAQLSWLSLEKLSLSFIHVNDKEIADILLGCPLLDNLILHCVSGIRHLNIASSKLRKLKLKCSISTDDGVESLEINTPCLQELDFSGNFEYLHYCGLVDVSSLVFAKVTFAYEANANLNRIALFDMVAEVLKKLHHVEELIVGPLLIEALTVFEVLHKPSPLFKCKKTDNRIMFEGS